MKRSLQDVSVFRYFTRVFKVVESKYELNLLHLYNWVILNFDFIAFSGSEVFVGNLPRDYCVSDLYPIFSEVGEIINIRIMKDFTGTNRGYAYIQYSMPEEAELAIRYLNRTNLRPGFGKTLNVLWHKRISCLGRLYKFGGQASPLRY